MNEIELRKATPEDCERIFQWQSYPDIRRYCRNPIIPTLDEHKEWFYKVLHDKKRELYIVEYCRNPAGLLRLDEVKGKSNTYEVSILTAHDWQKHGVAIMALRQLRKNKPTSVFVAEILKGNKISMNLFHSAGYHKVDRTWYINNPSI